ncbi:MAG TPA: translation initiation factor IF-3, partial [Saprospiraceae bacterium]|nr:translation initiation factor IF-3 [Saprospiraceae bacterium]
MNQRRVPVNKFDELKGQFRINEAIRNSQVRLVGDNFEEISEIAGKKIEAGVYYTDQAIKWAFDMGLDLVEITGNADPPVCKIIDFKK